MQSPPSLTLTGADLEDYLRYQSAKQPSSFIASIAHPGNSVVCLTQSSSSESWILDSGASDHISGNPHLLSHFTKSTSLPTVTLANGSIVTAKAVGCAHPLPLLPLESIFYLIGCPSILFLLANLFPKLYNYIY